MSSRIDFTSGSVPRALIHFALPVMFALFLQAMYGTVDLLIVGQLASSTDVSAVATGSQIMQTVTNLISSLATGTTVLLGQKIGQKKAFRRRQNCRSLPDPFCPHRHCLQPLIDPGCGPLEPRHECSGSRFFEDGPLSIHLRRRRPHHDLL